MSVERNIYKLANGSFEVGYRDSQGKQRWKSVVGGITAARAERDRILGDKASGKRVQPNPRLTFGQAADRWLAEQVSDLRPTTQASYENSIRVHLRPRWGNRRLDYITVDDVAKLVRELRAEGRAESSIATILRAASRTFKFAARRMAWHGIPPTGGLENGERPKLSQSRPRRLFKVAELEQTIAAAHEPYKALFALAAVTGARESELLGLVWSDLDLSDTNVATVSFNFQVDRKGQRQPLKTERSRRRVQIPKSLALMLLEHKARSVHCGSSLFVFSTRMGRPIAQRNLIRELRRAMKAATDDKGRPTFPALHEGRPIKRGELPTFHGFRHTAASQAIHDGDSAEEVSWQLGHRSSLVTRAIYITEIQSAEREAKRREKMEARYGSVLEAATRSRQSQAPRSEAEILKLRRSGDEGQ